MNTEDLNRRWYEANTGQVITDVQQQVRHPALHWMAATLDGRVEATGAVFGLPWSFSEEAGCGKVHRRSCSTICGSCIAGGGAVGDHWRWKVGRIAPPTRSALSAPRCNRRAEILALRGKRRAPSPIRGRAAKAAHPGGPDCGHERLQRLGRNSPASLPHPGRPPRTRTRQLCQRMPGRRSATAFEPSARNPAP